MTMPWLPMPTLVPMTERKAGEVRPSSNMRRHSSSMVRPRPPYSTGTEIPKRPSSFISSTISSGTLSDSETSSSIGRRRSSTKRRTEEMSWSRVSASRAMGLPALLVSRLREFRPWPGGGQKRRKGPDLLARELHGDRGAENPVGPAAVERQGQIDSLHAHPAAGRIFHRAANGVGPLLSGHELVEAE